MEKFRFFELLSRLKHLPRKGWVIQNIPFPETVASHMYRMAMCVFLLPKEYDTNKLIKMALVHDLGESIIGDITPHDNISKENKYVQERKAMVEISQLVPDTSANEIMSLWEEYEKNQSADAMIVKDLDKLDMILQGLEYEKMYGKNLEMFFEGLDVFKTDVIREWAAEVYRQRNAKDFIVN